MANTTQGATRLAGFDQPTVWTIMTPLALKTQSINLGQGMPVWGPPQFYLKHLTQAVTTSNHQYGRSFGSLNYTKAIAEFHKPTFGQLDHENNICVTNGGAQALFCSILGLINPGEELILFDPSYTCYRPQVQMAGGKTIGIPLIPRKTQSREELLKRLEQPIVSEDRDQWDVDFDSFEKALNQKTKILVINSPHNPTGKVFTQQELERIASILQKYPQVIVLDDNVYEGVTFDDMYMKPLPKIAFIESMKDRTISIYSAGKILSATGMRMGWMIGAPHLIKAARSVHQYNVFCFYNPVENAVAKSIEELTKPENTYLRDTTTKLTKGRNLLVKQLLASNFDWSLWVPKGSTFVLADISKIEIKEKYMYDEDGKKRSRDYAFAYQLAYENKVVCTPMSPFYDSKDIALGERYVRFAFCLEEDTLREAGKRLLQ